MECHVVETNYIAQLGGTCVHVYVDLDGVHNRTFICPRKKRANFMKKSSELGTTSDLAVVHTLICSLWSVSLIGLRNKTKHAPSFSIEHHLFCSSASFHFLEKSTQMPLIA